AEVVRLMIKKGHAVKGARVLVLGFTFKENCPDLRNTRVIDLVSELRSYGAQVDIHDPLADPEEARREYDVDLLTKEPEVSCYDAIVVAVGHDQIRKFSGERIRRLINGRAVVYDIKGVLSANDV